MRLVAMQFAAACGREVEYVGVTRDTSEADLKQRREIRGGCFPYRRVELAGLKPRESESHPRVPLTRAALVP
jgi:hypothetical protein